MTSMLSNLAVFLLSAGAGAGIARGACRALTHDAPGHHRPQRTNA
jgi:hypothetical protein